MQKTSRTRLRFRSFLPFVLYAVYGILIVWLGSSVVRSGYHYVLDVDEYFHVYYSFLISHGVRPFADVYISVYTPLFALFLAPVFWIFGFTLTTIPVARIVMIVLFFFRIGIIAYILRKVADKKAAFAFIPLLLLDPFTIFSGMQIRPDNFMLFVYSIGLVSLFFAFHKPTATRWAITGMVFGVATVTLIKIIPFVGIAYLFSSIYLSAKGYGKLFFVFTIGLLTPVLLFAISMVTIGAFDQMITQMISDTGLAFSAFANPQYYGSLNRADNLYVFGVMGAPLSWMYVWLFPSIGFAGAFASLLTVVKKPTLKGVDVFQLTLVMSLVTYQVALFFIRNVYLQYYLPITWLYAYFGAVGVSYFFAEIAAKRLWYWVGVGSLFVLLFIFTKESVTNNLTRATITEVESFHGYGAKLAQIPDNEGVFPDMPFHPLTHPFMFGYFMGTWDFSPSLAARYPSIKEILIQKKVRYLILSDWDLRRIPPDAAEYVRSNYHYVNGDDKLMRWNE